MNANKLLFVDTRKLHKKLVYPSRNSSTIPNNLMESFFPAFEIDEEDGNLVDYFVDDLPVREIEVDQDEDQFVPEKIARAATYEFLNFEF